MNKTLLNMLAKTVDDFQSNWAQHFRFVMVAFRTSVLKSTGYTPQFLVSGEEIHLPLDIQYASEEQRNKPTCISLFSKNVPTFKEPTIQYTFISKLLKCDAMLCIILKRTDPHTNQVTKFGYITLSPLKDWVPNSHPVVKVHIQLQSALATFYIKSKTQRSKKRPSSIMTNWNSSFNAQKDYFSHRTACNKYPEGTDKQIDSKTAFRYSPTL